MATKKEIRKTMTRFHDKVKKMMRGEKLSSFTYDGDDDDFKDLVSHVFSSMSSLLQDIEAVLDSK